MNILDGFPADWRCDITVKRSGGRDANGDPQPDTEHVIPGCLVGDRKSDDPDDRSDTPTSPAIAYAPVGADIRSTDVVVVPSGHFMAGTYHVDGKPGFWPLGTEIRLQEVA